MQVYQFQVKWKDDAPETEPVWQNFAIGEYDEDTVDDDFDNTIFYYAEEIIELTNPNNSEDFYVIGGITNE
jgi:hypothetical protein